MADASGNQYMMVWLVEAVALTVIIGFDGQIDLEALRLYGLPEAAPALLCGTPALPVGQREFAAEVSWDLPSLAPGATSQLDVTVPGARQGTSLVPRWHPRRASSNSTPPRGPLTPSALWPGTSRRPPSVSGRQRCRYR